jgi:hypothetical protein
MSDLVYRRLRAPSEDGNALVEPPLEHAAELVCANHTRAGNRRYELHGLALRELASQARGNLIAWSMAHTGEYRDISFVPSVTARTPLLLAGHQPELFHPGVWFKNFLLSAIAEQQHGIAINLIVDTDVARSPTIRVPSAKSGHWGVEPIAIDATMEPLPFEERPIRDSALFASFGRRVQTAYRGGAGHDGHTLLIEPLWKIAVVAAQRREAGSRLGQVLAEARHIVEGDLGLKTLEIPLSLACQGPQFSWFAAHLLSRLPYLARVYNETLAEYRRVNHVRSHTHPAPNLAGDNEWLEAPFLLWRRDDPRRRHAFVRQVHGGLEVSDREVLRFHLDISADSTADKAVEQLQEVESRGIKLRPRALITTMYARLVLSDLFIHGIGGAKYDELTDAIIRKFFGIEPPAYVTATATFRLPIERLRVTEEDVRDLARKIREARYRPEALLSDRRVLSDAAISEKLAAYAAEKRDYLARHDLRRCAQEVFNRLDSLNRAMHELLQPIERELRAEHAELLARLKESQLLGSREFSFVLFPSEILPARLLDLCKVSS